MLKIIEIGTVACPWCRDGKQKPGVEFETFGYHSNPRRKEQAVAVPGQPRRIRITMEPLVWREQGFLCLKHFGEFLGRMIDDLPLGGLWEVHKQAAMRPGYVNITYEEAQRRGLV